MKVFGTHHWLWGYNWVEPHLCGDTPSADFGSSSGTFEISHVIFVFDFEFKPFYKHKIYFKTILEDTKSQNRLTLA